MMMTNAPDSPVGQEQNRHDRAYYKFCLFLIGWAVGCTFVLLQYQFSPRTTTGLVSLYIGLGATTAICFLAAFWALYDVIGKRKKSVPIEEPH